MKLNKIFFKYASYLKNQKRYENALQPTVNLKMFIWASNLMVKSVFRNIFQFY